MGTSTALSHNALMMLLFGVAVAVFFYLDRLPLRRLPRLSLLLTAYLLLVVAWASANAAALLWADIFGLLQHVCYLVSSVLMAVWCWTALRPQQGTEP